MQLLTRLVDTMQPAIEIYGWRDGATYRCEKCSNRKSEDVRHPIANFTVLDRTAWQGSLGGDPFVYILTAVCGETNKQAVRYVGIGKSDSLMRRWTRMPEGEKFKHADGTLLHHMPATIPRLERDLSDPEFQTRRGYFRLHVAALRRVNHVLSVEDRAQWKLPATTPHSQDACYAIAEELEDNVIQRLKQLSLSPWNGTRGASAALSSDVLRRGLTLRSTGPIAACG